MNGFKKRAVMGIGLGSAVFASACTSTSVQSIQRAPGFQPSQIRKVLVVSATRTPGLRDLLEGEFVRQWKTRGVEAVASAQILPAGVTLNKAGIVPVARAQGFDSVLVTRLVRRGKIEPKIAHAEPREPKPSTDESTLTQDVDVLVASPEYSADFDVAVVSAGLYAVATEKRVWSGVTQTLVTGEAPKRVRAYAKVILDSLYQAPR